MRQSETDAIETPADYAMPAEWGWHDATWMSWPHHDGDWPGKFGPVPWAFAEIVRNISRGERVSVLVEPSPSQRTCKEVQELLEKADANMANVSLNEKATNRVWARDSGPIFITSGSKGKKPNGELAAIDFKFNGWAKYDDTELDDRLPAAIAEELSLPCYTAYGLNNKGEYQRFVLEGGSIDVNGAGCLLTTEQCLLSKIQERNPGFSRQRIERTLCAYLGVERILWLKAGIAGDDTHGHIDDTARFVNETTIVACVERNKRDENYAAMRENALLLKKMRDARGKQLTIVDLPMPEAVFFDGQRLPASYANFYIANAGVLVPVFNDVNDARALKVLEECFKDRPIIPVYCRDLVWGLGTIHCLTQQQPAI